MEVIPNVPLNLSSKFPCRISTNIKQHRFYVPISKSRYTRSSLCYFTPTLQISARFGVSSRRRNSLRKKLIDDQSLRLNPISSDPGTKPRDPDRNFDRSVERNDDLVELTNSEGLKERVPEDSNLLNELENWVVRYKKEAEYWGIGSNPIFMVYQGSNGNVEKVEVNEDEILRRRKDFEDLSAVNSKVNYAKELAKQMENGENVIPKDSSVAKFVCLKEEFHWFSSVHNAILRLDLVPKLPIIGRIVIFGFIVIWILKMALKHGNSEEMDCTELEKEMMKRKMKAWKAKETIKKGNVEVLREDLEESLISFERPKLDQQELISNISKAKDSKNDLEVLKFPRAEGIESVEFDDKINEIKTMARRVREIEAEGELDEQKRTNNSTSILSHDDEDEDLRVMANEDQDNIKRLDLVVPEDNEVKHDSIPSSKTIQSSERPKLDQQELISNISKAKDLKNNLEVLKFPRAEGIESVEFDDKINEIKTMDRRVREIEAEGELDEQETRVLNVQVVEVDEDRTNNSMSIFSHDDEDEDLRVLANEEVDNIKRLDLVVLEENEVKQDSVPTGKTIQSSDDFNDKSCMKKNGSGYRPRLIQSVKEAKEFISRRNDRKMLTEDSKRFWKQQEHYDEEVNGGRRGDSGESNETYKPALDSESFEKFLRVDTESVAQNKDDQDYLKPANSMNSAARSSLGNEHKEVEQSVIRENWIEKNFDEFGPIVEKMAVGFRDNYMAAREKNSHQPTSGTIADIAKLYPYEDDDELEWMNDDKLRDIVFRVRDNELAGRDPFYSMDTEDKAMFFQGLEKKVEKVNEKLSHLHQWLHSNIENLDYGIDGISLYDPPEKIIPRWKGPPLEKNPEFLNTYNEQRSTLNKEDQSSLQKSAKNVPTSSSDNTVSQSKIVIERSDGSIKPGKKSGKEFWTHTKKWSRGFLELYNAETDPEVKSVMRDMGKDLDRWITEEEIKDAAELMDKLPEKNKKWIEKKLNKLKREMEQFGPQAVVSKYREYGEEKEEDYLWWLDLPHVLCLELYTVDDEEQQVGFYALEMAKDLELEPKPNHVIAFEDATDCKQLCYIIQAHLDMLGKGNVFIVPRPPKDAFREAKGNGFGVTVIRKGELKLNVDQPLEEVEEQICEIGSKMYHDQIMGDRSVDISSLMKGVFGLKTKPSGRRRRKRSKRMLRD